MTLMNAKNLNLMTIAAALSITMMALPNKTIAAYGDTEEVGACTFSQQLEDNEAKKQFQAQVREARESSMSRYGEVASHSVQFTNSHNETQEIDTFSVDCLSCHDGVKAKGHDVRYKNNSEQRIINMDSVMGSHPIGMHYGSYAYSSKEFKSLNTINPQLVLVDGKVGCLTCHNPLNPKKKHLAMTGNLCVNCHKI